ncbi:MAG: DNA topoisomerase (ATP-hydrolyzing) subunit A [Agathobaculum sp.]|uniref:DNA gyrase/topoisomerase IV subunit A n=1 Tax=Agathobaculum sp. TaxID=2048138 RepID=UPI0025C38CBF|nr:DNA topoisomerase (ATP-hydrolyzing) subunit A [Agathobaculum sp.]MCI7125558.1 DNA topoisomerase (ATP-hydrolyzing) subunit A [Agathobaculum sp.]MDY3711901.1 DNA topoisomerase (ATP-hydrolyzing) subunit A [Agathobaculum sp.]
MAKKKNDQPKIYKEHASIDQRITDTLRENYMPYAMSVIVSRAIPEIDGFKPSHRKLLYTMYKMGLLNGNRTKSANIVGATMKLNPHGDSAIYETMVRLTRGNEALLTPFIDSKGNFGKVYSRDMAYAAPRYTEAKLDAFCGELFRDIDADAVDFADNYDGTQKEPVLLPTTFPNILVSANTGIAVGMASSFCGFNLEETCRTAIEYIKNPAHDLLSTLPAPDFTTGGELIYDEREMRAIYETGRGSFKVRAKWELLRKENLIEVTELPYTTTIEAVIDKVAELVKAGKIREIADIRDETDLSGLKIAIDLKRGADADKLMAKLMKMTPLMDSFSCNFNVLIGGMPRVLGVRAVLEEWTAWRTECVRRRVFFDLTKKKEKLHLLHGLAKILLDIDKAIRIIRETEEDAEVIPNLMIGFGIDQLQAEYIADIRLRNINKEYILKRTQETEALEKEIGRLGEIVKSDAKIRGIIIKELEQIIKKYPAPRRTRLVTAEAVSVFDEEEHIEDYPVLLFLTREGYFKKITPQSWRMSQEHKLKEGDAVCWQAEATNKAEIIFLTTAHQAYKARLSDFDDSKASVLGDYLPQKLGMDEGEAPVYALLPGDYKGNMVIVFQNGKSARFSLESFETKTNRRRLTGAYSDKSPAVAFFHPVDEQTELTLFSTANRALTFRAGMLDIKASRATQGVQAMVLRGKHTITRAVRMEDAGLTDNGRYRCRAIPSIGALLSEEDLPDKQMTLD